jgi:hypothetical protein
MDPVKLYRFLLRDGDAQVADALTRAIRNDPPTADRADRELRSLPRAKASRRSSSSHRVLARLLRSALRQQGD